MTFTQNTAVLLQVFDTKIENGPNIKMQDLLPLVHASKFLAGIILSSDNLLCSSERKFIQVEIWEELVHWIRRVGDANFNVDDASFWDKIHLFSCDFSPSIFHPRFIPPFHWQTPEYKARVKLQTSWGFAKNKTAALSLLAIQYRKFLRKKLPTLSK